MRALLALLLALTASASAAQGTGALAGRVVEAATGQPLPHASVRIEGTTIGTTADAEGAFQIIGVPGGAHRVTAVFVGYRSVTTEVTIRPGYTAVHDFTLEEGAPEYSDVCRSCWHRPLVDRDPFASRIVTGEEMERLPVNR